MTQVEVTGFPTYTIRRVEVPTPRLTTLYVGIDPGSSSGGLAAVTGPGDAVVQPMPATEADLWEWLSARRPGPVAQAFAMIELVHAMPRQGVSSTFTFGTNYGALRMALTAAGIPYEAVTPRQWQAGLGIRKREKDEGDTAWKNYLKGAAQRLFPGVRLVKATADAVLIAEYCRRKRTGTL